ncbi:hypothetical protein [Sphingosinicella sp. BN140058]|uniref:hypothetical protein n=1 Tax=Sphingosinicella sp. BN140058 TaxID=1892855 RepID=UPI001010282A|nr:hypothetical protein [Sphingosinicella sp. BN140058]QAY80251.1 hypothetical protein ETR14_26775 [Sphingosinicella sp. BN140058]
MRQILAYLIVPFSYRRKVARAKRLIAATAVAPAGREHDRLLRRASFAVRGCEIMQRRFPGITHKIDLRLAEAALRKEMAR